METIVADPVLSKYISPKLNAACAGTALAMDLKGGLEGFMTMHFNAHPLMVTGGRGLFYADCDPIYFSTTDGLRDALRTGVDYYLAAQAKP